MRARIGLAVLLVAALPGFACAQEQDEGPSGAELELPLQPAPVDTGIASWYGPRFHGRRTASGERYDMHQFTAAHRTLPFGTVVRVVVPGEDRSVDVRINDRGPHVKRRVIDLSRAAARALGLLDAGGGLKPVVVKVLKLPTPR